jgi:hypothetical protein
LKTWKNSFITTNELKEALGGVRLSVAAGLASKLTSSGLLTKKNKTLFTIDIGKITNALPNLIEKKFSKAQGITNSSQSDFQTGERLLR